MSIFDIATPFFEADRSYRRSVKKYLRERNIDRDNFLKKIRYWRKQGYINTFIEKKERFIELTSKGKRHLKKIAFEDIEIKRPVVWDGKWRLVIFDIPEGMRSGRDIFRTKLKNLGFKQIQRSVYLYPFECIDEIEELSGRLSIGRYVVIMTAEIIQGEEKIVEFFFNRRILNKNDLKKSPIISRS